MPARSAAERGALDDTLSPRLLDSNEEPTIEVGEVVEEAEVVKEAEVAVAVTEDRLQSPLVSA